MSVEELILDSEKKGRREIWVQDEDSSEKSVVEVKDVHIS